MQKTIQHIGIHISHKCDNRLCVNPNHLSIGNHADNSADMVSKNRQAKGLRTGRYTKPEKTAKGEGQWNHKVTEVDVLNIRAEVGLTLNDISKKYNISPSNAGYIRRRITWKHI